MFVCLCEGGRVKKKTTNKNNNRVCATMNNEVRIFISCVLVTATHVPVHHNLGWMRLGMKCTHTRKKDACLLYKPPQRRDIYRFPPFRSHLHVYVSVFEFLLMCCWSLLVCLRRGGYRGKGGWVGGGPYLLHVFLRGVM